MDSIAYIKEMSNGCSSKSKNFAKIAIAVFILQVVITAVLIIILVYRIPIDSWEISIPFGAISSFITYGFYRVGVQLIRSSILYSLRSGQLDDLVIALTLKNDNIDIDKSIELLKSLKRSSIEKVISRTIK